MYNISLLCLILQYEINNFVRHYSVYIKTVNLLLCLVTYGQSFPCFQTMQYLSVNVMMPFLINFQIFLILTRGCKRGLALKKQTSMSASLIANPNKSDGQKK